MSLRVSYKIIGDSFKEPYELETRPGVWRFDLTEDGKSWLDVFKMSKEFLLTPEEFETFWDLHPEKKGKVKIMGKEYETPRWQQSYLKKYWFSGMTHDPLPLPKEFKAYLGLANSSGYEVCPGKRAVFNEVLVNWYEDGTMGIGPHSDDTGNLVLGPGGETFVWSATLCDEWKKPRTFRIKPKTGGKDRLDIAAANGLVMVMGGTCQQTHKHQVPQVKENRTYARCGKRINITCRTFKD